MLNLKIIIGSTRPSRAADRVAAVGDRSGNCSRRVRCRCPRPAGLAVAHVLGARRQHRGFRRPDLLRSHRAPVNRTLKDAGRGTDRHPRVSALPSWGIEERPRSVFVSWALRNKPLRPPWPTATGPPRFAPWVRPRVDATRPLATWSVDSGPSPAKCNAAFMPSGRSVTGSAPGRVSCSVFESARWSLSGSGDVCSITLVRGKSGCYIVQDCPLGGRRGSVEHGGLQPQWVSAPSHSQTI